MPLKIVRDDITRMHVDGIVNTANEEVGYGDGIDSAVYRAAGEKELLALRREIGPMREGEAAVTPGLQLPAKYIIHAVSPFYYDGSSGEERKLRACYRNALALAKQYGMRSIAFPLIATGSYGYPKEEGMRIAVDELNAFLLHENMQIYLVVFDGESMRLGQNIYPDLESYIDQNYVYKKKAEEYGEPEAEFARSFPRENMSVDLPRRSAMAPQSAGRRRRTSESPQPAPDSKEIDYDSFIEETYDAIARRMQHQQDTFQQYLFHLIEGKGLTNAQVYKRAIITKQTFSKIRNNVHYHPDKLTAMRLCIGAKLSKSETVELLSRAGYALSPSDKRDIIFSYFIEKGIFDMIELDIVLEEHGLPVFIE